MPYADFAAMNGGFASLDYSADPPDLFVGREVTFEELGMQRKAAEVSPSTSSLNCVECGATLEVATPARRSASPA